MAGGADGCSLPGCFGYELDLDKLSPEEQALIPRKLEEYRQHGPLFREGPPSIPQGVICLERSFISRQFIGELSVMDNSPFRHFDER